MTHSNIFDIVGNIEIGLYLFRLALSPFLYIGITFDVLKAFVNIPVSRD